MEKRYTVFLISQNGILKDKGWSRHINKQDAINEVNNFCYDEELLVLPIYINPKKQKYN